MHNLMMITGLTLAWVVRLLWRGASGSLTQRWHQTLGVFLFSPLLLLITAIAVLCMGPTGRMLGHWEGWFSYDLAFGFLVWAIAAGLKLAWDSHQSMQRIRQHPQIEVQGRTARLLDMTLPYSAQIGLWRSELVVSQGLLQQLDHDHLESVLLHEQAHAHYHDTFWFFGLGWLRRLTGWLPGTDDLWQELLMLRELRADRYAAQQVDPLVLAESLLVVVGSAMGVEPLSQPEVCATFSWATSRDRLTERIDTLLSEPTPDAPSQIWSMGWLLLVLLPLATIPWHVG